MAQEEKPKRSELPAEIELAGMTEVTEVIDAVRALVSELVQVKARARELGLFVGDRPLLDCPHCHLLEDVTIEGFLMVYRAESVPIAWERGGPFSVTRFSDTGLRFASLSETRVLCPACGSVFAPPDEEEPNWSEWSETASPQTISSRDAEGPEENH